MRTTASTVRILGNVEDRKIIIMEVHKNGKESGENRSGACTY